MSSTQRGLQGLREFRSTMNKRMHAHRALAHPAWVTALLILLVNDHLLKGAGILPGVLTGKLSDFAGLLVAPMLLASLLCVRGRLGAVLTHVAVGLGFAAINVWPAVAGMMETVTGWTPFPWFITVDPTDLIALPMIAVSWWWLMPSTELPARANAVTAGALLFAGSLACMATAPPDEQFPGEFQEEEATFVIANETKEVLVVRVRPLKPSVSLHCGDVDIDPTAILSRKLFAPATVWLLEPGRAIPIRPSTAGANPTGCGAVLIDGNGLNHTLLFWKTIAYPMDWISTGAAQVETSLKVSLRRTGESVKADPHPLVFSAPPPTDPPPPQACIVPSAEAGIEWDSPIPTGTHTVEAVSSSPDGCHAVDLTIGRWYVCIPGIEWPFAPGEEVLIDKLSFGANFGSIDGVEILSASTRLRFGRGADFVQFTSEGTTITPVVAECVAYHDSCGGLIVPIAMSVELSAGGQVVQLSPGTQVDTSDGTLFLLRAQEMPVLDQACVPFGQPGVYIESAWISQTNPLE